jgi:hypothetical protein
LRRETEALRNKWLERIAAGSARIFFFPDSALFRSARLLMTLFPVTSAISPFSDYPPPPRVHWITLLLAWFACIVLVGAFAPPHYQNLFNSLIGDSWAVYLCLWLRRLNPEAASFFWCDAYVVVEISYALILAVPHRSDALDTLGAFLALASAILAIATIFIIRRELLQHYDQREPIGLELSGVMTFFFSFLYFQAKLYPIARLKENLATQTAASSANFKIQ